MSDSFLDLSPDVICDAVEKGLAISDPHKRPTGRIFALNSIENRVLDIELEDKTSVVGKFYRPGRWSERQLLDEHRFVQALAEAEVPAVPPLALPGFGGSTLGRTPGGIFFALTPKIRGRIRDEYDQDQLRQLGRLLARLHGVGATFGRSDRLRLDLLEYGRKPLAFLRASAFVASPMAQRYLQVADELLTRIEPSLRGVRTHLVHGDCHLGNVLWNEGGAYFVDFDDLLVGPPVQDIWMIVRGRDEQAQRERDLLLEGYEELRDFDRSTLALIEPLRALRLIHYSAWIARRWDDPSFPRLFPHFGREEWWQSELDALMQVTDCLDGV